MKEILLTSTVLILVMVIARLVFRGKDSHRFLYGAWLLVAIRLLVPIQFGQFDFSVLNQAEPVAEVITEVSRSPISGPSRQEIYQQVSRDYSDLGYNIETPEIQVQIEETVTESITFWPALWIAPNFASHQADAVPPVSVSVAAE